MRSIFIRNFDVYAYILKYDVQTGQSQELSREAMPSDVPLARAFYVRNDANVIGVYASLEGPICFYNTQRFRLADADCQVELNVGETENEFRLWWHRDAMVTVRYSPTPYRSYDAWSATDADVDFFLWLAQSTRDDHFYKYFASDTFASPDEATSA